MKFKLIVAMCKNRGIGNLNSLPWPKFKTDMDFFSRLTTGNKKNAVVMGKNTFKSVISKNKRPLKERENLVLSTTKKRTHYKGVYFFNEISSLIKYCFTKQYEEVWIIGGEKIYDQFLNLDIIDEIYLTYIENEYECDTFLPEININYEYKQLLFTVVENGTTLYFNKYSN